VIRFCTHTHAQGQVGSESGTLTHVTACNFLASKPMQTERQGSVAGRAGRKLPLGHGDRWCMHLRHSYHVLLACADVLQLRHTRGGTESSTSFAQCTRRRAYRTRVTVDCAAGSQRLRKAFFKFLLHGERFLLASILGVSTLPAGTELTTSRANGWRTLGLLQAAMPRRHAAWTSPPKALADVA